MGTGGRAGPVAVEVDGTAAGRRVIDYAGAEAGRRGTDLLLVRAYHDTVAYSPMMPTYIPAGLRDPAEADLHDMATWARSQTGDAVTVRTVAIPGSRHAALTEASRTAQLLVVVRKHARGPHRAVAAGDLDLAGSSACPVIVVPPNWRPLRARGSVYVGIDGSALSREAIEFAYTAAADRRAHLVVVHAGGRLRSDAGPGEPGGRITPMELAVANSVAGFAARYPDVRVTRFVTSQSIIGALVGASRDAGLRVLGVHPGRLPNDPMARRTLAAASCPVAVVKHLPGPDEQPIDTAETEIVAPTP